ncbi:unnamed protein product, partial [Prorocentrum cordatum]
RQEASRGLRRPPARRRCQLRRLERALLATRRGWPRGSSCRTAAGFSSTRTGRGSATSRPSTGRSLS